MNNVCDKNEFHKNHKYVRCQLVSIKLLFVANIGTSCENQCSNYVPLHSQ